MLAQPQSKGKPQRRLQPLALFGLRIALTVIDDAAAHGLIDFHQIIFGNKKDPRQILVGSLSGLLFLML